MKNAAKIATALLPDALKVRLKIAAFTPRARIWSILAEVLKFQRPRPAAWTTDQTRRITRLRHRNADCLDILMRTEILLIHVCAICHRAQRGRSSARCP